MPSLLRTLPVVSSVQFKDAVLRECREGAEIKEGEYGSRPQGIAEFCLTVPSFIIHRIQEVHTTLLHILWDMVHVLLREEDII